MDVIVDRVIILELPDGSFIESYRHRYDEMAPWINGPHRVVCRSADCCEAFDNLEDLITAHLAYLTHSLWHAQQEIADLRRKAFNGIDHYARQ